MPVPCQDYVYCLLEIPEKDSMVAEAVYIIHSRAVESPVPRELKNDRQ